VYKKKARATTATIAAAVGVALLAHPAGPAQPSLRVLVFTKTAAYRHASIPDAVRAFRELGAANGFAVDATEDAGAFTDDNLRPYDVVAFVLTTGDVLDAGQQAAFERFVRAGGGYVGVHSAADTEYGWPWYGGLVGAYFRDHPKVQRAAIDVAARDASTARLPRRWTRTDEWYNFASDPSPRVRVLARLDERTYDPGAGAMGAAHPIAWAHDYDGGRAWYTGGGHTAEV
jgi:cytochrome c